MLTSANSASNPPIFFLAHYVYWRRFPLLFHCLFLIWFIEFHISNIPPHSKFSHSIFLPWCSFFIHIAVFCLCVFSSILLTFPFVVGFPSPNLDWIPHLVCILFHYQKTSKISTWCFQYFSIFKSNSWGFIIFGLTCPIPLLWYCGAICEYVGLDIISSLEELFGEDPISFFFLFFLASWY